MVVHRSYAKPRREVRIQHQQQRKNPLQATDSDLGPHQSFKGVPLRTAMMILKEPLEIKDFAPVWSEKSVKKCGNYVIWVTYNVTSGVAKVHIDSSIPFDMFVEAFENKFPSMATSAKGRGKGKGKGNRQGQQQAEHTQETRVQYPFSFQFIQVTNWTQAYDEYKITMRDEAVE